MNKNDLSFSSVDHSFTREIQKLSSILSMAQEGSLTLNANVYCDMKSSLTKINENWFQLTNISGFSPVQTSLSTQTLKGGTRYVQDKNKEVDSDDLRLLIKEVHGPSLPRFTRAVNFTTHCTPKHRGILFNAISNYLSIFSTKHVPTAPLWITLLPLNKGARSFSPEMQTAVNHLFTQAGLPGLSKLATQATDPQFLFNLAQYDTLNSLRTMPARLKYRIKILENTKSPDALLSEIYSASLTKLEKHLLVAFLMTQTLKNQQSFPSSEFKKLNRSFEKLGPPVDEDETLKTLQILNALNFYHLKNNNLTQVDLLYQKIEKYAEHVCDPQTKAHLLGNHFYQKATTSAMMGDVKSQIALLEKSSSYDYGYFDCYYRLAMVYHDQGDPIAKKHYEAALRTSPLFPALVNDYGNLLNDLDDKNELASWEHLVKSLNLHHQNNSDPQTIPQTAHEATDAE